MLPQTSKHTDRNMTHMYFPILTATLFSLTLHTAALDQSKLQKLFRLVIEEKLTCIRTDYADVINDKDSNGETALMLVARAGIPENITPLIKRGADPFIKDHNGQDVLTRALKKAYTFPLNIKGKQCMKAFEKLKPIFEIQDDQEIFERAIKQGMTFSKDDQQDLYMNVRIVKHGIMKPKQDYWAIYCLMLKHFPNSNLPAHYDEIEPH